MRVVQPFQRLHYPRLAVPVGPPLLHPNQRDVRLKRRQKLRDHIPDQMRPPLVAIPFGVSIVDHVLGEVSLLEAASDLVIVADTPLGRGGNEDGPMVESGLAGGTRAAGELCDSDREVARRNLNVRL